MPEPTNAAQFTRASWRLGVLIPSWTIQTALLLCIMGIFSYRLAETTEHWDEMRAEGDTPRVELVWEVTNVSFSLAGLVLTILEITRMAGEVLTPFFLLASHGVKLTLAIVNLVLDGVVYRLRSERGYSIVGLGLDCGLLVATIIPLTYAALTFRRLDRYDDYVSTPTTTIYGSGMKGSGGDDFEMGNNVQIFADGNPSKRASWLSGGSDAGYSSHTEGSALKIQVDTAVGMEFGWGPGRAQRSGSLVRTAGVVGRSAGVVGASEALRRGSERGIVGDAEYGEEEEDDGDTVRGSHDGGREVGNLGARTAREDDTRALLASDEGNRDFAMPFRDRVGHTGDG